MMNKEKYFLSSMRKLSLDLKHANKGSDDESDVPSTDDVFDDEKLEQLASTVILNKYQVDEWFYEAVKDNVNKVSDLLILGLAYEPGDLYGVENWNDLTEAGKEVVTLCLRHMASLSRFGFSEYRTPTGAVVFLLNVFSKQAEAAATYS